MHRPNDVWVASHPDLGASWVITGSRKVGLRMPTVILDGGFQGI